jgi:glycosyltransferase involved in cell wall biosynthesis
MTFMTTPTSPKATPYAGNKRTDAETKLRAAFIMEQDVGHAVQAIHLQRELRSFPDIDWNYIPVTFWSPNGLVEKMRFVPQIIRASYRARLEVHDGLRNTKPDALFWNTQKPAVFCTALLRSIPSVISLDVTPTQYDELGGEYGDPPRPIEPLSGLKHRLNRRMFSLTRKLLPATEWVAQSLVEDYGVPRERIEVLAPGTDLERFKPSKRTPGEDRPLRVLFVGGDLHRKGGDVVLEWFQGMPGGVELDIVTRDRLPGDTRARVHRLSHEDPAMQRLYQEADVFVLPTRAECFGLVLTEAMASGVPCVTSPVGGLAEVVEAGVSGLHVPPGDAPAFGHAMRTLLEDEGMRKRLGEAGRRTAELRFDAKKNVKRIIEIMSEVAEEKRQQEP